jgi:formylglycine-generating enzyme required for sulfatase activity
MVFSHLVHNGVCESPPSLPTARDQLFANLTSKNVGFKQWHPTSVRAYGGKLLGRGETGGAWEWTSTVLEPHEGFAPGRFYPEYTGIFPSTVSFVCEHSELMQKAADFFDGKHNVVLGGSWATHPRIAGRKSLYVPAP